ncbi:hypothetical protein LU699_07755 [Luteimonas fraxinea]|uniref:TerB family tellurite resistance protein n=1 Tax=Luteimonas fraxinea TaxID=2901869 RepID=A0ABS8UCU0_9GAMM|nr:hypothetical protein [Luteimonas fraxinea]MCD9097326.1 hypothetical protein [Luteimonas fraxinea]MCD9125110.1 hypothetical protein [Luteimonas fraxinea]UHH11587.1 hypothetical protein LU699_07755 [Luteimonas fraxinea]
MPHRLPDHLQLALAAIPAFADDGRLSLDELDHLLGLALRDQVIDADETRVLGNILDRAERDGVDADVQARIMQVRTAHDLPAN